MGAIFIKICGVRDERAAQAAASAGADAVGFMFYSQSRRFIEPAQAAAIGLDLPRRLKRVGVFVNASLADISAAAETARLDWIQLHGEETPELCAAVRHAVGLPVVKAFRVSDRTSLLRLKTYDADYFLLDTARPGRFGGTGEPFDWSLARLAREELALPGPVILAGGLSPANVAAALAAARPYGVDVSSGVETGGCKDPVKIREFVEAVRGWERERQAAAG